MQPKLHTRIRKGQLIRNKSRNLVHRVIGVTKTSIKFQVVVVGNSGFRRVGQRGEAEFIWWDEEWEIILDFKEYYEEIALKASTKQ